MSSKVKGEKEPTVPESQGTVFRAEGTAAVKALGWRRV